MEQSKYDTDQDGVCDAPECKDILAITDSEDPYPKQAALIAAEHRADRDDARRQGARARRRMYNKCNDLDSHAAICLGPGWGKDYPAGYTFAGPLFDSSGLWASCCNYIGLGATPEQIKEWGYTDGDVARASTTRSPRAATADGDALSSAGRTSTRR